MGRRVEKQYKFGTYTAEFSEEMPPLGSDRKTQFLPDARPEKMAALGGITLGIFLANLMKSMVEYFGEEVWEVAERLGYEIGRQRAATMIRTMEINDFSDARYLGRIMDLEDNNSGIRGEWVETGKKRSVKHEYECPIARPCKTCPEVCSVLLESMERGTFDALGVKIKKPVLNKIMPMGDPYCEVRIELEE